MALFAFKGGCGSMYEVLLESEEFKGHRTVAQHRMVNEVSISDWSIPYRITFNVNTKLSCFRLKYVYLTFNNISLLILCCHCNEQSILIVFLFNLMNSF